MKLTGGRSDQLGRLARGVSNKGLGWFAASTRALASNWLLGFPDLDDLRVNNRLLTSSD
jgi:hypothetical protein